LVRRGLAPNRERAEEAIAAGLVLVSGSVADNASRLVAPGEPLELAGPPPRFVGRGGEKLDAAIERFAIPVDGRRALDAGASTGGFTDCLLQRGAAAVTSVELGYGQFHERLRADPRVTMVERTDIRRFDPEGAAYELIVADLSFISLGAVAPDLVGRLAQPGADVVTLVKPQYEADRAEAAKGRGIVRDPEVWRRVLGEVRSALGASGAAMMGAMVSPLTGADGNVEFLAHWKAHAGLAASATTAADLDALVQQVVGSGP
jgi:23S rRNA (cytidine1920-2'-O)/16S rRNA (cytidine1409-2'-O)-methyltransferase